MVKIHRYMTVFVIILLYSVFNIVLSAPTETQHNIRQLSTIENEKLHVNTTSEHTGKHNETHGKQHGHGRFHVFHFNFEGVATPYAIALWVLLGSIAKIGFHMHNKLSKIFPESCLLIVLGVVIGLVLFFSNADRSSYTLDAHTFFLFLLPPIVLEAGYFMPSRAFFSNLGTILLFAIIGTLFNTVLIGFSLYGLIYTEVISLPSVNFLHCLLFGSLISAVDPVAVLAVFEEIHVNEILYIVVFGESLLNDGVSVVLYRMFETYSEMGPENIEGIDIMAGISSFFVIAIGGTAIGILFGLLTAFITKYTDHVRVIEPLFVFVMAYLSYLTAEMFELSGILAIVFCGMSMKQYVEANISKKSHTTVKYFMKMMSSTSETVIFVFLGLSTVVDTHVFNFAFVGFTLAFCLIYRAIGVLVFTALANRFRLLKINWVDQFIMGFGGLRGAIAFSLVILLNSKVVPPEAQKTMITTTIVVIYFTVFIQGTSIKPLVNLLRVKKHTKRKPTMNEHINGRFIDHLMAGIEDITGFHAHHYFRDKFEYYNVHYLRKWLMRETPKTREHKLFKVFTNINLNEAMEHIARHGSFSVADMNNFGTENSLAKLIRNYSAASLHSENSENSLVQVESKALISQSNTCLDMQAIEAHYCKKMADDSKIHHILSDNLFNPRLKLNKHVHQKHQIHELQNHPPFHHKMRYHLRHMLTTTQQKRKKHRHGNGYHSNHQGSGAKISKDHKVKKNGSSIHWKKNVSFADQKILEDDESHKHLQTVPSDSESEDDGGITFTAKHTTQTQNTDQLDGEIPRTPSTPTAIEKSLPWKRNTGRMPISSSFSHALPDDNRPPPTDFPPWVDSIQYSSVVSPQVSLNIPTREQNISSSNRESPRLDSTSKDDIRFSLGDSGEESEEDMDITNPLLDPHSVKDNGGRFANLRDSPTAIKSRSSSDSSGKAYVNVPNIQNDDDSDSKDYDDALSLPWRRTDDTDAPMRSPTRDIKFTNTSPSKRSQPANTIYTPNEPSYDDVTSDKPPQSIQGLKYENSTDKVSKWIKSHSQKSLDNMAVEPYVDMSRGPHRRNSVKS